MSPRALAGLLTVGLALAFPGRADTIYRCGPSSARTYSQTPCENASDAHAMTLADARSEKQRTEGQAVLRADRSRADRLERERLQAERQAGSRPAARLTAPAGSRRAAPPARGGDGAQPRRKASKKSHKGFTERFISPTAAH